VAIVVAAVNCERISFVILPSIARWSGSLRELARQEGSYQRLCEIDNIRRAWRAAMASTPVPSTSIIAALFEIDSAVRYVALFLNGTLTSRERAGLSNASASESDKYEELIVNPTLLKLVQQRGDLDCGGMEYVLIRYGNFFQFVHPIKGGHVSVGIEPTGDPMNTVKAIRTYLCSRLL
jgi:hypothetical protein